MILSIIVAVFLMAVPASAESNDFFKENGFELIKTTAYCCGEITANGSKVHYGGCASSAEHMGDIALIYTIDGEFIGQFEVNDAGGTDAIRNGWVIDVYHESLDECKAYMEKTRGKCYVKYIHGEG